MPIDSLLRLLLVLIALSILLRFFQQAWREHRTKQQQVIQQAADFEQQRTQALTIVAHGGPHNRDDYFVIFPDACPHCGSRSWYRWVHRDLVPLEPLGGIPSMIQATQVQVCIRCGFGNAPPSGELPLPPIHSITSPYLDSAMVGQIPELAYDPATSSPSLADWPTEPLVEGRSRPDTLEAVRDGQWQVYLKNDEVTPVRYVTWALEYHFKLMPEAAIRSTLEADQTGEGYVTTLSWEEAHQRASAMMQRSHEIGFPIMFVLRQDNEAIAGGSMT